MNTLLTLLLFAAMVISPILSIILVWKKSKQAKWVKLLLGILLAAVLAFIFFIAGMIAVFPNGIPFR